jgi:hypothetical protein
MGATTAAAANSGSSLQFLKGEKVMDFPLYEFFVSKQTMAVMLAVYLVMIVTLRKFMVGRKPFALTVPMKVYNIAQVALNIYMIWGLCVLSSVTNLFGINEKYTARLEYFVFVHYMSKFLDYFDTVFIILRVSCRCVYSRARQSISARTYLRCCVRARMRMRVCRHFFVGCIPTPAEQHDRSEGI